MIDSIKNSRDKIRASVSVKSHNFVFFVALLLIFIMALIVRITPIIRGDELIKAFDPWIQWYNAEYIDTHSLYEYFHWHDDKSWYPYGVDRSYLRPGLPFTAVFIHKFLTFIGLPISMYDVCYYFPAVIGAVSVVVMYFLGKEILDKKCGLLAAFFMAFSVGYMSRTMAGFFDNETIGVFGSLMAILFFIKAYRTGKITHSIIGGLSLGYVALSWGGYEFLMYIFPIIVLISVITKKYNENMLIAYVGVQGIGALIFSLWIEFNPGDLLSSFEIGAIFASCLLLIIFHLIYTKRGEYPRIYRNLINLLKWGILPIALIGAVIIWFFPDVFSIGLSSRLQSILNPLLRNNLALVASVAEHIPSPWSSFYHNTLIPLLLVPLGIYFCFKRGNVKDIALIVTTLLLFYFTGSMVRVILLFAPIASLAGAYGLSSVLNIHGSLVGEKRASGRSRKRQRQAKNKITTAEVFAVYAVIGFICFAQVTHAVDTSVDQLSYGSMVLGTSIHDWEESLSWMRDNLNGNDVVVSWWDYGYWLTPIGNVTTVCDNANLKQKQVGMVGMGMMQTDEIYAAKVFQRLQADYVLVYFTYLYEGLGGDEGKWQWMLRICNDNYEYYKSLGMEEDNWGDGEVFDESEYTTETGVKGDKWFDCTLTRLMFYGVPTIDPSSEYFEYQHQLVQIYNQRIYNWEDQDGDTWLTHIPTNGAYESNVFVPVYFGEQTGLGPSSSNGLVKLFKVDYTVLESSFEIQDAKVYNSGYGTFNLQNTGTKDLTITGVSVNGVDYNFTMGKGSHAENALPAGADDTVKIDLVNDSYPLDSLVSIDVSAEAEGLARPYEFTEHTGNFWVTEAEEGDIKMNEQNCRVVQITNDLVDIFLDVENVGSSTVAIDKIYIDEESNNLIEMGADISYTSGSSILSPGQKAIIHISDIDSSVADFDPINEKQHVIGISTYNGVRDELLLSSSYEGHNLTIYDTERIISPEIFLATDSSCRYHLPVDLDATHAISYDNGTTQAFFKVKNYGTEPVTIGPVYITTSDTWMQVNIGDYSRISGGTSTELDIGEEGVFLINITESEYFDIDVNDELGMKVIGTGSGGSRLSSAIAYVHTISEGESFKIIESVDSSIASINNVAASYVLANGTGRVLVKNTGSTSIDIDVANILVNDSSVDYQFVYGDAHLELQECALIQLDVADYLDSTQTPYIEVNISTTSSLYDVVNLPVNYNIEIDETASNATEGGNLNIVVNNYGLLNATINALYVNNVSIDLSEFSVDFEIEALTGSLSLTLSWSDLENYIGTVNVNDELEILISTQEGAEDDYIIVVD
ncbi:MAG: glycosyltransferase family 39 protein [Candidatus Lokiarchaeota archaeon]|nr:glycosyltransferase family 39 protein [Candidatus Lokiarchaeota archaeon]